MSFEIDELDKQIARLKIEQDLSAYRAQAFECKRKLLEIDRSKVTIALRAKELENKIAECELQIEAM
jgi:hypothetical protein